MVSRYAIVALAAVVVSGCGGEPTLQPFSSESGKFSVSMPPNPKEGQESIPTAIGTIKAVTFNVEDRKGIFMVVYSDYPERLVRQSNPDKMLEGACNGAVTNVKGTILEKTEIAQDGYPGRELTFELPLPSTTGKGLGRARFFLVNNRLYQAMVIGTESRVKSGVSDSFLKSFQFHADAEAPAPEPVAEAAPAPEPVAEAPPVEAPKEPTRARTRRGARAPSSPPAESAAPPREMPAVTNQGEGFNPGAAPGRGPDPGGFVAPPDVGAWKTFTTRDAGFSVKVPDTMVRHEDQGILGAKTLVVFVGKADGATYTVQVQTIPTDAMKKGKEAILDASRDALTKEAKGEAVGDRIAAIAGQPAREYRIESPELQPDIVRVRSVLIGRRLFDLFVTAPEPIATGEAASVFFDSFRLSK